MFGKHIHAFILLIISAYKRILGGRVYVWRLILKKNIMLVTGNNKDFSVSVSHFRHITYGYDLLSENMNDSG